MCQYDIRSIMRQLNGYTVLTATLMSFFVIVLTLIGWKPFQTAINPLYEVSKSRDLSREQIKFYETEELLLTTTRYQAIKQLVNDKLLIEHNSFNDMFHLLTLMDDNCSSLFIPEVNNLLLNAHHFKTKSDDMIRKLSTTSKVNEGFSGQLPAQVFFYMLLARQSWVQQVCEIGFNAGHSALYWLASSNKTRLLSFDLGSHDYAKVMATYMKSVYPDRFQIVWGDSTKSVPNYVQSLTSSGSSLACDVIVVDGGHAYEIALADIKNMRAFAKSPRHLVIVDDAPCVAFYCDGPIKAMRELRQILKPMFGCIHYPQMGRGFSLGYYVTAG